MDTSPELIRKLADLARLELTAEEVERLSRQLPTILDYVSQLQRIPTARIESEVPATTNLRSDEAQPSPVEQAIIDQAPERTDRFWKVDAVFN